MKKRLLRTMLGMSIGIMTAVSPAMIASAEDASVIAEAVRSAEETDSTSETSENESVETTVEAEEVISGENTESAEITTEAETENTESEESTDENKEEAEEEEDSSDFQEGSALLSDYDYKPGTMDDEKWESEMLDMDFEPGEGIKMSSEDKELLDKYYNRNGDEKVVAANEMVAVNENDGYVQLMVEVNPNMEEDDAILDRFAESEGIDLASKTREIEIAGKKFSTRTGAIEKEKYLIGVSTEENDFVIAIKIKYSTSAERRAFLSGFGKPSEKEAEEEEAVAEETEASVSVDEETETLTDIETADTATDTAETEADTATAVVSADDTAETEAVSEENEATESESSNLLDFIIN